MTPPEINANGMYIIDESGLYSLIMHSKLPSAEKFQDWITEEVLPTIRKTGGYVSDSDLFINTYLPFADTNTKALFKQTLDVIKQQNDIIKSQEDEISHQEDVILGLVDTIDLAEKRAVLNRLIRYKSNGTTIVNRYLALYREFQDKYHINLDKRLSKYNMDHSPKMENKLDYIDRVLNMIPQLYELACKLYKEDVEKLVQEIYDLRN